MEMMVKTPTKYFFVKGSAEGLTKLNAFDNSLLNAGIGDTNLIRLSSIVPPACQETERIKLPGGSFVPIAYASLTSDKQGEIISAGVAIGIPEDDTLSGLIMEYSAVSHEKVVQEMVEKMVVEGFRYRNRVLKEVRTAVISTEVKNIASVFAGIVLWY